MTLFERYEALIRDTEFVELSNDNPTHQAYSGHSRVEVRRLKNGRLRLIKYCLELDKEQNCDYFSKFVGIMYNEISEQEYNERFIHNVVSDETFKEVSDFVKCGKDVEEFLKEQEKA